MTLIPPPSPIPAHCHCRCCFCWWWWWWFFQPVNLSKSIRVCVRSTCTNWQCDQMARFLNIYKNENWPNSIKNGQSSFKICQILQLNRWKILISRINPWLVRYFLKNSFCNKFGHNTGINNQVSKLDSIIRFRIRIRNQIIRWVTQVFFAKVRNFILRK